MIAIVLGENDSSTRNSETMELLDYGFNNLKGKVLKNKGEVVDKISFDKASNNSAEVILSKDLTVIEEVGSTYDYSYSIKIDDLKLPIKKNTTIGKIIVTDKGKIVTTVDLWSNKSINKLSFFKLVNNNLKSLISGNL